MKLELSLTLCSVTQSWSALCDPMDCSLQGSSVHEIFQARVLELVAISYLRLLCLLHWQADSLPLHHVGSPDHQGSLHNWSFDSIHLNEGNRNQNLPCAYLPRF